MALAHLLQLKAIVAGQAKTDNLDAALLARLLRVGLIPEAYVPPRPYQSLRDLARGRARLSREATKAKNQMHALLTRRNIRPRHKKVLGNRGRRWVASLELGEVDNLLRDELLSRLAHSEADIAKLDAQLDGLSADFPQEEALRGLFGFGRYTSRSSDLRCCHGCLELQHLVFEKMNVG